MGKRSNFKRVPRDFYPTPPEAVAPLIPHLPARFSYWEPCAGELDLVFALASHGGECVLASDIEVRGRVNADADVVVRQDALTTEAPKAAEFIITNFPWERAIMHKMIERFSSQRPTWVLFDADWAHTRQSAPFMPWLRKVVSVGRVKWIPDSNMTGKDNCAWHLFDQRGQGPAEFYGRVAA